MTNSSTDSQSAASTRGTTTDMSSSTTTRKAGSADAGPVYPSDFPASAQAGTTQRFAPLASDLAIGGSLAVIAGYGSTAPKNVAFKRADGSALVALYYPAGTTVPTGSVYVKFGEKVAVPIASGFADDGTWIDAPAGQRAKIQVSSYYATPSRVVLLYLNGDGTQTAPPSATPSTKPSATPTPIAISPPSNACVHFRTNPMCAPLPSSKRLASNTGAWTSLLFQSGRDSFQHIEVTSDPNDRDGGSEPLFALDSSTPSVRNVVSCDKTSWSQYVCGGKSADGTIQIPKNLVPASNSDHHASILDSIRQGEQDFWLASAPGPDGATIHVGGTGFCSWSGDGTGCSGSTATNIATSLGGINPVDVQKAEASANGVLPYAIGVTLLCADPSYVFPATASDGSNTNSSSACSGHTSSGQRPPEGSRAFIDKSDADINATSNKPYVKVILRTMDRDHFGLTVTDTNWSGAPGIAPQYSSVSPVAWAFATQEAGLPSSGTQWLPITNSGINLQTDVKFCSNGTC